MFELVVDCRAERVWSIEEEFRRLGSSRRRRWAEGGERAAALMLTGTALKYPGQALSLSYRCHGIQGPKGAPALTADELINP